MVAEQLKKEFEFFIKHQEKLANEYPGKFLIIKDQAVQGVYENELNAYSEGKKKFELGTFVIQRALLGKEVYTQTFHSQATFAS